MTSLLVTRPQLPIWAVVFLCALISYAFAPGHMDADVLGMLSHIKSGTYVDWHPLLLTSLLKLSLFFRVGPVGVLVFQVFAIGVAIYKIVSFFSTPLIAALTTNCILLCPSVLGYLGALTSHGILVAFTLLGCCAMLYTIQAPGTTRRALLLAVSFAALSLATLARQNGPAFTIPGFGVWVFLVGNHFGLRKLNSILRAVLLVALSVVLPLTVNVCGNLFFRQLFHPHHTDPAEVLFLYDISAISLKVHQNLLDKKHFPSQNLDDLKQLFDLYDSNPLVIFGRGKIRPLNLHGDEADRMHLQKIWLTCIMEHPMKYLGARWKLTRGLIGLDFKTLPYVPFHPGIDTNQLGYHVEHPDANHYVVVYLTVFSKTFVNRPIVYFAVLLLLLMLILIVRPRSKQLSLVVFVLASGSVLNVFAYSVTLMGYLLRYMWPSTVTLLVASGSIIAAFVAERLKVGAYSLKPREVQRFHGVGGVEH